MLRKWFLLGLALMLTGLIAGCGKSALEQATGLSVGNDGSVTIKGEDGETATLTSDEKSGEVTIKGSDGSEVTISGDSGPSAKVPDGFPLGVIPGAKITSSMSSKNNGKQGYTVSLESDALPKAVADFYESDIKAKGMGEASRTDMETDGELMASISVDSEKNSIWILINRGPEEKVTTVLLTWSEK